MVPSEWRHSKRRLDLPTRIPGDNSPCHQLIRPGWKHAARSERVGGHSATGDFRARKIELDPYGFIVALLGKCRPRTARARLGVREVQPGGWFDYQKVRRHGSGTGDLEATRGAHGRVHLGDQPARRRFHIFVHAAFGGRYQSARGARPGGRSLRFARPHRGR